MKWALLLFALIAFFNAVDVEMNASSAIHQILGSIDFLIAAVYLTGACIVEALTRRPANALPVAPSPPATSGGPGFMSGLPLSERKWTIVAIAIAVFLIFAFFHR